MEKWLPISQISKEVGLPETTVRRYLHKFDQFFRYERRGRGKKYHPDSVAILERIALLYGEDYESDEIEEILAKEFAFTVDDDEENAITIQPPLKTISEQFEEFKLQQKAVNQELLDQLKKQQEYIETKLEERDRKLMSALKESMETQKQLSAGKQKKKWWDFWK